MGVFMIETDPPDGVNEVFGSRKFQLLKGFVPGRGFDSRRLHH